MSLKRVAVVLGAPLILSGCVAVWGDSYSVKEQTASTFKIQYDPSLTSSGIVKKKADDHCKRFGKKAELQGGGMPGALLGIIEEIYYCVD